jgi:hypothetical protein
MEDESGSLARRETDPNGDHFPHCLEVLHRVNQPGSTPMKTKVNVRRKRSSELQNLSENDMLDRVWDEELEAPFGEATPMCQERDIPALEEYLRAFGLRIVQ